VTISYVLIAVAALGFILANYIRDSRYGMGALVVGLMCWFSASTFLFALGRPGSLLDLPLGSLGATVVLFGFVGTLFAVVMVFLLPPFWVLAWLADRIPTLRRHHIGDGIRRQIRGKLW